MADPHACAGADLGLGIHKLLLIPAGDDDIGAGKGESASHGLTKSLAAARHKGHAPGQIKELMTHYN